MWKNVVVHHRVSTSRDGDHWPILPAATLRGRSVRKQGRRHFRTNIVFQLAVLTGLYNLDTDFYDAGFDGLVYRWNKCLDKYGEYAEKYYTVQTNWNK
ncbi:hypothetical protein TNCV_891091 [Trichonephila clavipes]|nr:hypothetical protein TNCV_891091 [Trichonephila clavipes]